MARTKILLADDHTLFCNLLRELLEPEFEVVGTVGDGHALLKAVSSLHPDVVLIDIGMPKLNGMDAGRRLKTEYPQIKLIYLTMNHNVEYAREAMRSGASGFLLKNTQSSELVRAIRGVLGGTSYVAPEMRQAVTEVFVKDAEVMDRPQQLTDRQREVLQMVAEGRSLREISNLLKISYRTVRFHKVRLMGELGASKDVDPVKYAMKHGLIYPDAT